MGFTFFKTVSYTLQKYFQSVTAFNRAGNISAVSDGITIVLANDVHNFEIYDGLGCEHDKKLNGNSNYANIFFVKVHL